ncbi:DUF6572 domain-containing protein [Peribacillus butanolivorans]
MVDLLDWKKEEKHALLLYKKIKECIALVDSKEIHKKVPETIGKNKFVIQVFAKYECNEYGNDFYEIIKYLLQDKGYQDVDL